MNTQELYAIQPDQDGWRVLSNGSWVTLGNRVTLGNWVTLGKGVRLGDGVTLVEGSKFLTSPPQVQCHPYMVYQASATEISVGCIRKPVNDWLATPEPDELTEHPECRPWSAYRKAIEFIAEQMNAPKEQA